MSKPTKRQIAQATLELTKKYSTKKSATLLAAYLIENHRSNELDAIVREIGSIREDTTGVVEVNLTSAQKLDQSTVSKIMKLIDTDSYVTNNILDESVVGGVRVETSAKLLDLTVRNRLNKLREGVIA
ncbi:MAG TPA: F0F1 ATP synthase subunit delta [Candidatus Saccharibacteria bacterium]|nr:F0F1 ATP synthase subunit delta [Candidatus Saccharibacteria bacterium]